MLADVIFLLIFFTFLLFSFFLRDWRLFPMRHGNFLFRLIIVVVNLLETFLSSSYIAFTRSWASWKYLSSSLANGFGICSSVYRFFRLLSMNDNKSAAELKASFIVVKQDSHFATSSLPLQPSTPGMNLLMFWHTPHFSFLSRLFSLSDKTLIWTKKVIDLDSIWIQVLEVPKGDAILRWLGEKGGGGIMKPSTTNKGGSFNY